MLWNKKSNVIRLLCIFPREHRLGGIMVGLRMVEGDLLPAVEADGILKGERDVLILSYCYPKERTAKEIASFLKIQPSTYFRKNVLGSLVSDGLLQARTAKRITTYMTNPARVRLKT